MQNTIQGYAENLSSQEEENHSPNQVLQKYISRISHETLEKFLIVIDQIAMDNDLEDGKRVMTDSAVVETDIHYPTNNALVWDSTSDVADSDKLHSIALTIEQSGEHTIMLDTPQSDKEYQFQWIRLEKKR